MESDANRLRGVDERDTKREPDHLEAGALLPAGPLTRAITRNILSLVVSRIFVSAAQFGSLALLAVTLGPSQLGVYLFAVSFAVLFRLVPNFGLGPVVTRNITQAPAIEGALLPNVLYLRFVLGLVAYGLLAAIVTMAGFGSQNRHATLVAGTLLVFVAIDCFRSPLQARLKQVAIATADAAEAAALLVGILALAHRGSSVTAYLALYVCVNVANSLIVLGLALRTARFDWRPRLGPLLPILRAAAPLALAVLFLELYFRMDILILARLKSEAAVGQYGVAYRFLEAFLVLSPILTTVVAPVLAQSAASGQALVQRRYARLMHLLTLLALAVSTAGAMTAWRWFPLLPGFAKYHGAGSALAILSPAAALALLGAAVQSMLISAHLQRRVLMISAAGVVLNLAANLLLIPRYSYTGAAIATTVTEIAACTMSIASAHRLLGLHWPLRRLARAMPALLLLAAALTAGYFVNPFVQVAVGILVYAAALFPTGALRRDDLAGMAARAAGRP